MLTYYRNIYADGTPRGAPCRSRRETDRVASTFRQRAGVELVSRVPGSRPDVVIFFWPIKEKKS